jgi:phage shock protein PspC (stress-responsive transcriptional regulator)
MKEITRIHIAKVPYSIELDAKKELETYLKTLEAYSEDAEILTDIEIRITEILADRSVRKDDIISKDDVAALKQQLGEPREFMSEGDMAVGTENDEKMSSDAARKLYRNTDNAVLGGVLSGMGAFFGVNPVWIRLIFIILALGSFGGALLVYAVLWVVVPPAKTAADKLQMVGRAVTITSIRELNENDATKKERGEMSGSRRFLTATLGVIAAIAAAVSAGVTATGVATVSFGEYGYAIREGEGAGFFLTAFILAIVSGVLLTALFIIAAYAAFAQKMTRRVWISMIVVSVVGLAAFGTAVGLAQNGSLRTSSMIKANTHETVLGMPANSSQVTALAVAASGAHVQYIVSSEPPKTVVRTISKDDKAAQKVTLALAGKTLEVSGTNDPSAVCNVFWCDGPYITVYGPALEQIDAATQKTTIEYRAVTQQKLTINTAERADVSIASGTIESLTVNAKEHSEVNGTKATIAQLAATLKNNVQIEFATLKSLEVNDSGSCAANGTSSMELFAVSSGSMMINGAVKEAKSIEEGCLKITVEGNEDL